MVLAAVVLGMVTQVWMLLFCKLLLRVVAGEASQDVHRLDPIDEAFVLSIPSFFLVCFFCCGDDVVLQNGAVSTCSGGLSG